MLVEVLDILNIFPFQTFYIFKILSPVYVIIKFWLLCDADIIKLFLFCF